MEMGELTSGEEDACRQKAVAKVDQFLHKIEGLSEEERFYSLRKQFKLVAECQKKCAENLHPRLFAARENSRKSAFELSALMRGAREGLEQMRELRKAMEQSPLAHVNGTSFKFAACSRLMKLRENKLPICMQTYENAIVVPPPANDAMAKIACTIGSYAALFMAIEDCLAA